MDIGKAIYDILSNDSAVSTIVEDKIYPLYEPQTVDLPCITYQQLEPMPTKIKDGVSPLDEFTVQINSIATSYTSARDLADKVRTALDFKNGTYGGLNVQFIAYQSGTSNWNDGTKLEGAAMIMSDYLFRVIT